MRFRITIRSDHIEARGWCDGEAELRELAAALDPLGIMVVASPAAPDYAPFGGGGGD